MSENIKLVLTLASVKEFLTVQGLYVHHENDPAFGVWKITAMGKRRGESVVVLTPWEETLNNEGSQV